MKIRTHSSRGVALVIVLAFVVLITILVVGLSEAMRLDRSAAKSYLDKVQASQFAQMGVDSVVATFRSKTSDPARNWIARPGQLIVGGSATPLVLSATVLLYSGASSYADTNALTGTDSVFNPPNLNVPTFRSGTNCLITDLPDTSGTTVKIQPKWIYVRKDGSLEMPSNEKPSTLDTGNPIVGRYAYWSDDESSRVNYNIAWGRSGNNKNPDGDLTKVDLTALQTPAPALDGTAADALRSFLLNNQVTNSLMPTGTNWYFFNTPEDARRVTQASTALQAHRFEVTHYNHDPDTTFFNEPRIVLTTRPDRAGWTFTNSQWVGKNGLSGTSGRPYYIRILKDEGNASNIPLKRPSQHSPALSDPGTMAALDTVLNGKVDDTIRFLIGYLQRTDWPMVSPANSIQSKYYTKSYAENYPAGYSTKRLAQLAVNIIDYVRSKESELDLVEPLRTAEDSIANPGHYISGSNAGNSIYGPLAYIGQTRAPRITEVGCWFDTDNITHKYKVEVYLPRNYGLNSISFNNIYLQIQWLNSGNGAGYADEFFGGQNRPLASSLSPVPATLSAGGYVTLTFPSTTKYYVPLTTGLGNATTPLPAPRPSFVDARFSLWSWWGTAYVMYGASALSIGGKAYQVYDRTTNAWIPGNNTNTWIHCPVDPVATPENGITSVEVDDPRLNLSMNNWVARALGSGNTFGAVNSISALNAPGNPTVPAGEPQQDTDAAGTTISTASLYMPPPAGKTFTLSSGVVDDNTLGMVLSAGELGYIHTGIESSSYVFNTLNNTTVTGTIPKGVPWRTLRLQPNRDGTNVVPDWAFMDLFSAPVFAPTGAEYVYSPGAKDTTGRAKTVGGRVNLNCKPTFPDIDRTQPLAAVLQGSTYSSTNTATLSPTQAATLAGNIYHGTLATGGKQYGYVDGYDSPGEIVEIQGIADQGEASEELVRKIANLITTRGNVFSVYSIGQALKQTPTGGLTVVGEQRLQAMIERIEYTESAVKKVRFSPVYYRNLTP